MRHLIFVILCFVIIESYSQNNTINGSDLIDSLITKVNNLPKTNTIGKNDIATQSKYNLEWNNHKQVFQLTDVRYKPNSNELRSDKYTIEFKIQNLHNQGLILNSSFNNGLELIIFTAKNSTNFKYKIYNNEAFVFKLNQDRLKIGAWDSNEIYTRLDTIRNILTQLISLNTRWTEIDKPKTNINTVENDGVINNSPYLNATIDSPALFGNAKNQTTNALEVERFILNEYSKNGVSLKGKYIINFIIDEFGNIDSYKFLYSTNKKIVSDLKNIITLMPKWTPGIQNNQPVKTTENITINYNN